MGDSSMTVGGFLNFGVENAERNFLKYFGLVIASVVAMAVGSSIFYGVFGGIFGDAGFFIAALLCLVLEIVVGFGFIKNTLNLCRGKNVDFKAFISAKPMTIANTVIVSLALTMVVSLGMLLFIVPGIILFLMLMLAPILVIDRDMGAWEAIRESVKLTSGRKMDIFAGFFVSNILISIANIFIIPLIFTIPMGAFIYVYPYLNLTGQLDEAQRKLAAANGPEASANMDA